jgi:predicted enzyme related to lactoylglutathione lyase
MTISLLAVVRYQQADTKTAQTQKKVEELGGRTCCEKTPEGENGWYMYFIDVAGNRFGIYQLREKTSKD